MAVLPHKLLDLNCCKTLPFFVCAEMVRNYQSQHKRAQWSEKNLVDAVAAYESGMSLKQTAKTFCIPRTTLRNHRSEEHTSELQSR